jgi:hypothetical protein
VPALTTGANVPNVPNGATLTTEPRSDSKEAPDG